MPATPRPCPRPIRIALASALLALGGFFGTTDTQAQTAPQTQAQAQAPDPLTPALERLTNGRLFDARAALADPSLADDPRARYLHAWMLGLGLGGDRDEDRAIQLLATLAEQGNFRQASNLLADWKLIGPVGPEDIGGALQLFRSNVLLGDVHSAHMAGLIYARRDSGHTDPIQSFAYLALAAGSGNQDAANALGAVIKTYQLTEQQMDRGDALRRDLIEQIKAGMQQAGPPVFVDFQRSAAIETAYQIGVEQYNARQYGVALDTLEDLAEDQIHGEAAFYTARIYEMGYGVEADPARAVMYYSDAVYEDVEAAFGNLSTMAEQGVGMPQNRELAVQLAIGGAYRGWWSDQANVAGAYFRGVITEPQLDAVTAYAFALIASEDGGRDAAKQALQLADESGKITAEQKTQARERARQLREDVAAGRWPAPPSPLPGDEA